MYEGLNKMIKSMTGYGRGEGQREGKSLTIEMKAINHRFSEIVIRSPKIFSPLEDRIRKKILTKVARGRVDVFLTLDAYGERKKVVQVDKELAAAYYQALKELETEIGIPDNLGLKEIALLPDVLKTQEEEDDLEELWKWMEAILERALATLLRMRQEEGVSLKSDLSNKLAKINGLTKEISHLAPLVVEDYRQRLQARIQDWLPNGEVDQQRILTEVAIFADRCSIDEEVVRLGSHIKQMESNLNSPEPVGRKLDFLIQEMNREINTIGSKANDVQITGYVVEAKSELEKMREQIQNIE